MDKNLIIEVETVIKEVAKTHRYSMSQIYGLYNRIFGTNEIPQSCASCLIRKVGEIRKWLDEEKLKEPKIETEIPASEETNDTIHPQAKTNKAEGRYNKKEK